MKVLQILQKVAVLRVVESVQLLQCPLRRLGEPLQPLAPIGIHQTDHALDECSATSSSRQQSRRFTGKGAEWAALALSR